MLLPLRSPLARVAEELASLDVICDGKLIFGAGIGYREVEFRAFGSTLKQSGKRFEECLEGVKRLWSGRLRHGKGELFRARQRQLHRSASPKAECHRSGSALNANVGIRHCRAASPSTWFHQSA